MKRIMQEKARMQEVVSQENRSRNAYADRLIEKWSKKRGLSTDGGKFEKIMKQVHVKTTFGQHI